MSDIDAQFDWQEQLEPGLRYTERLMPGPGEFFGEDYPRQERICQLWAEGIDEPVSELEIFLFHKRFGAVSVPSEGLGGVATQPQHRRQGYIRKLLTRVRQSMASRVDIGFISEGVEGLYERFGFATCLAEGHFVLPLRFMDRLHAAPLQGDRTLRPFTADDLPAMASLYNGVHALRPWTHARPATWNQLRPAHTWRSGSQVIVLAEGSVLAGYAIVTERRFGVVYSPYIIHELAAVDHDAARRLLAEVMSLGADQGATEIWLREPLDSAAGRAARSLGGEYRLRFPATGSMMGSIFHRARLLAALEPELQRRLSMTVAAAQHDAAFPLLERGELVADDQALLFLLLGYWSAADLPGDVRGQATDAGPYAAVLTGWFPGGGTPALLQPYAHELDRY